MSTLQPDLAMGNSSSRSTLLTVHLNISKRTFYPTFKYLPFLAGGKPIPCSCSQATAWSDNTKAALKRSSIQECTRPLFVLQGQQAVKEAEGLCDHARRSNGTDDFIPAIRALLIGIVGLCSGTKTTETRRKLGNSDMQPFRLDRLDNLSISQDLLAKIKAPLNESEGHEHGLGYVYILRSQSPNCWAELKIGFTKYHPEHRSQQLAHCHLSPEVVSHTPLLPHARRLESIIHAELASCRKMHYCGHCRQTHQEWFTISHSDAREVITRWGRWMMLRPYHDRLLSRNWLTYLTAQDWTSAMKSQSLRHFWDSLIDNYPLIGSRQEQVGIYLNAIFFQKAHRAAAGTFNMKYPEPTFQQFLDFAQNRDMGDFESIPVFDESWLDHSFDIGVPAHLLHAQQTRSRQNLEEEHQSFLQEILDRVSRLESIKTGCISAGQPEAFTKGSPLGDSTMLPIVSLDELRFMDDWTCNFIGYTPTNKGFQLLQEAYAKGEWNGSVPRFKWMDTPFEKMRNEVQRKPQLSTNGRKDLRTEESGELDTSQTSQSDNISCEDVRENFKRRKTSKGKNIDKDISL